MSYDLEFRGATVLYSWPSAGSLGSYTRDQQAALASAHRFEPFLAKLLAQSGADVVHVVAHSMGNETLVAALGMLDLAGLPEGSARLRNLVFAAPDVDADIFRSFARRFREKTPSETRMTLYASSADKALSNSEIPNGEVRAGYFNSGTVPEVLVPGLDTVDASRIESDFLEHSYYGDNVSVLSDLLYVLCDWPPDARDRLDDRGEGDGRYWRFLPSNAVGRFMQRLFPGEDPWTRCQEERAGA